MNQDLTSDPLLSGSPTAAAAAAAATGAAGAPATTNVRDTFVDSGTPAAAAGVNSAAVACLCWRCALSALLCAPPLVSPTIWKYPTCLAGADDRTVLDQVFLALRGLHTFL